MYFTKDKAFYRLLLSIALPVAAQNLLTFSISMADSIMVGVLGEVQLSAASVANKFFFIMMILLYGIAGGSNVLIAQYWGKEDKASIHKVLAIMYRVILAAGLIFFALAQLIPEQIINLYASDPQVISEGAIYLRAVSWGWVIFALTNATVVILRSVQVVKISSVIYGTSLAVNTFFNWVLIYGNLGAPQLGIAGAAYATVLSRVAESVILLIFLWRFEKKLVIRLHKLRQVEKPMLRSFIDNCLPVIANEGIWVTGSTVVNMITGRLGTLVIAASNIEGIVWQLVTVFLFGLQNSTSVIVGNTIGAGKQSKLREYTRTLTSLAFIVGPVAGAMLLLLRPVAIGFYPNFDAETLSIATELMLASSVLLIFQSVNFIGMMGILRGGGDLRFVLVADVIFLWTVSIPLGLAAAFLWHWPVPLVFICLRSDEVLKSLVCLWRIRGNAWAKDLTLAS